MEVLLIAIMIICLIGIIFSLYMLYRNEKVAALQIELCNLSHDVILSYLYSLKSDSELNREYYDKLCKYRDEICNISYDKMLLSITRPLTMEEWLTNEQIEFLKLKFE